MATSKKKSSKKPAPKRSGKANKKPASLTRSELMELGTHALEAQKYSYSPYSRAQVGAAVLVDGEQVFLGCNIENSSFGATICAERVAIQKAISEGFHRIHAIAVATHASPPWPPCGLCRQVMAEFASPDLQIVTVNEEGESRTYTLGELLPSAFTPAYLKKK